jgi:hypothetical protein
VSLFVSRRGQEHCAHPRFSHDGRRSYTVGRLIRPLRLLVAGGRGSTNSRPLVCSSTQNGV